MIRSRGLGKTILADVAPARLPLQQVEMAT